MKDVKVYKHKHNKSGDTRDIEGEHRKYYRDLRERGRREERCRYTKEMRIR